MRKYVIITDSGSDLGDELRTKYNIEYVPMHYIYDGKDNEAHLDWRAHSPKEFYDIMRGGTRIYTAAVNIDSCTETFEKFLAQGYDILAISTTGALSTSANSARSAKEALAEKYPDAKIICIDCGRASAGLGIQCVKAAKLREEGKTIEETAAWINENKKFVNQEGTVEKLTWLKQAGRVSFMSAFFGDLIGIKPLIIADVHGYNVAVEKVKGRKASLEKVADRIASEYIPNDLGIFIHHADCLEDALLLKEKIKSKINITDEEFTIGYIGPAIGAAVGPGMIGIYFYGEEVTLDSLAEKK